MFLLKDFLFVGCFAWVVMCRRGVALQFLNQKQKKQNSNVHFNLNSQWMCVCVCVCARGWRRVSVCAAAFASLSWTETTEPLAKTGDTLCMAIEEKPARIRTSSLTFSPSSLKLVKNKTAQTRRPCCLLPCFLASLLIRSTADAVQLTFTCCCSLLKNEKEEFFH